MWRWIGIHLLEILVFVATGVEAWALALIYRLERHQFRLQQRRNLVNLRVDIDLPEGSTTGIPSIWIENAAPGTGFIESVRLNIVREDHNWYWNCHMTGKRKLPAFESVQADLAPALGNFAKDNWEQGAVNLPIQLWASVVVLVEGQEPVKRDSRGYRASVKGTSGELSDLIPVYPSANATEIGCET